MTSEYFAEHFRISRVSEKEKRGINGSLVSVSMINCCRAGILLLVAQDYVFFRLSLFRQTQL